MMTVDCLATSLGKVKIERANADDLPVVVEVVNDVLRWLTARGLAGQWGTGPVPADPDRVPSSWTRRIAAGEQYIATNEGRAIAAFGFSFTAPAYAWVEATDDAGYVSLLVVRRELSGQGLGRALLDLAGRWTVLHGKQRLRLDCWADNERLCRYYVQAGFTPCGEYHYTEEWRGQLFEKQL
jgi:GNAT superfamily N-acetyltransferase